MTKHSSIPFTPQLPLNTVLPRADSCCQEVDAQIKGERHIVIKAQGMQG